MRGGWAGDKAKAILGFQEGVSPRSLLHGPWKTCPHSRPYHVLLTWVTASKGGSSSEPYTQLGFFF